MKILLIDKDQGIQQTFSDCLNQLGHAYFGTTSLSKASPIIRDNQPHMVFVDMNWPRVRGVELVERFRGSGMPEMLLVLTAWQASVDAAVAVMRAGAWDLLQKPVSKKQLSDILERASSEIQIAEPGGSFRPAYETAAGVQRMVSKSKVMGRVLHEVENVCRTDASILLSGESGTGKEVIARIIHENSARSSKTFVPVNCAAMPADLLENELFGHEKGAYTGAMAAKMGLIEYADKGTIFLDEISEMNPAMQAKLLRFLEDLHFRRIGGNELLQADVRVIAATNIPPHEAVEQGKLRSDLFYRLSVINIAIPPLRERPEDIPELIDYFFQKTCSENNLKLKEIDADAMKLLSQYAWPGNVRELKNIVHELTFMNSGPVIRKHNIPTKIYRFDAKRGSGPVVAPYRLERQKIIDEFDEEYFTRLIKQNNGNITKAAAQAKVSRKTLYAILNRIGYDLNSLK